MRTWLPSTLNHTHTQACARSRARSHAGCVTPAPRRAAPILPRASLGTRSKPRTPDTLANPLSPSCSVLTSVSGASLIHLRMSALPSAGRGSGCESLRQLQRISYVTRLSVYIQPYLPSCSRSASAKTTLLLLFSVFFFFFFLALLSRLIISVSHATMTQTYSVL